MPYPTLTMEHEQSTVSGKIFQTLIPACFQRIRVGTEATFSEVNATLPLLLCRFVAPDQAGQIMASIFTCLCNYNTEICGMAMAQTIVPVYTIPNTYRVQQSLWESLCQIIPGITRTSGSELHSFEPTTPCNVPVGHSDTAPGSGRSGGPRTGTVGLGNPQNVAVSLSTCEKDVTQGIRPAGLPDGIPPVGSKWALFPPYIPTVNIANDGNPPDANLPETSTPIKATPESGKCHSKKKLDLSKIEVTHLLFDMWDRQEKARRSVESKDQAAVPDQTSGKERGSGRALPHGLPVTLPDQPGKDEMPPIPTHPTRGLPNRITSALMIMTTRIRMFWTMTSQPSLQRRKRRRRRIKIQKKRSPPGKTRMKGHGQAPRWSNQRKFRQRRPQSRKRRRNRKRMLISRSSG